MRLPTNNQSVGPYLNLPDVFRSLFNVPAVREISCQQGLRPPRGEEMVFFSHTRDSVVGDMTLL